MYMNQGHVMKKNLANTVAGDEREFLLLEQVYLGASVLKRTTKNPALYNDSTKMKEFRLKCRSFLVTAAKEIKKRLDFGDPVLSRPSLLDLVNTLGHQEEQSLIPLASCLPTIMEEDDMTFQKLDGE